MELWGGWQPPVHVVGPNVDVDFISTSTHMLLVCCACRCFILLVISIKLCWNWLSTSNNQSCAISTRRPTAVDLEHYHLPWLYILAFISWCHLPPCIIVYLLLTSLLSFPPVWFSDMSLRGLNILLVFCPLNSVTNSLFILSLLSLCINGCKYAILSFDSVSLESVLLVVSMLFCHVCGVASVMPA